MPLPGPPSRCRSRYWAPARAHKSCRVPRRQRGIAGGRTVQIQGEVVGQDLLLEDIVEQFPIALAQHNRVVLDLRVVAVGAEIADEESHRLLDPRDAFVGISAAMRRVDKVCVDYRWVGV